MKLASVYHHIDNGGISVDISHEAVMGVKIELSGQYFGYPSVVASLAGLDISSEVLEKIGLAFISASQKMKEQKQ